MGDEQRLTPEEQLAYAREQFEDATDFTLAVEEEFALLDPDSLELADRFGALFTASRGTELDGVLVGELISSEVEVKTGRCESFPEAAATVALRRRQLAELAGRLGVALCATGTHPWSRWQDQSVIDTPHYRRVEEGLGYVAWRNNTFGLHVHVGIRGADRAVSICDGLRPFLPDLLALSASSPFTEGRQTQLHSARSQLFTRMFPRCGIPGAFGSWSEYERYARFLYATGSIGEYTQIWWSIRPHLAFPTVEVRICDGQPQLEEAQALAGLVYSLVARVARALDEGEPLPEVPDRLIEENMWRAIRHGLSGELIDLRSGVDRPRVRPARAALEQLAEWVEPVAAELGAAGVLGAPEQNSAERQLARFAQGETLATVYAQELVEVERVRI